MKVHFIRYLTFLPILLGTVSIIAMEQKETALSFDLDDVVSAKEKIGVADYLGLVPAMFMRPKIFSLFLPDNFSKMRHEAHEIGKSVNGTANVVHKMVANLQEQGYGDFTSYEDDIITRSLNPRPLYVMIDTIKKLKKKGYTVVGATNQDHKQHEAYRKKMKEYGIDMNELFNAVVTTRVNYETVPDGDFYHLNNAENIYVAHNPDAYKPNKEYFEVVARVVKKIAPHVLNIIHTDDQKENCAGAFQAKLKCIHFKLAGGTAQKTSEKDLEDTIKNWEKELAEHKINVQ